MVTIKNQLWPQTKTKKWTMAIKRMNYDHKENELWLQIKWTMTIKRMNYGHRWLKLWGFKIRECDRNKKFKKMETSMFKIQKKILGLWNTYKLLVL